MNNTEIIESYDFKKLESYLINYNEYLKGLENNIYTVGVTEQLEFICDEIIYRYDVADSLTQDVIRMSYLDVEVISSEFDRVVIKRDDVLTMSEDLGVTVDQIHNIRNEFIKTLAKAIDYI
ncbi:hypothetical protein [Staphylococcus kloosii]|uniref:hypothetical protein n=1 Tax=Staphylococcus kloosii TaxID=29384 RepID=UPI00189FBBE9|nr:hypothetical protein [Staphylococcus kloosii]MBF7023649.1 hypothetical protein [Staphylococcus kloosii]